LSSWVTAVSWAKKKKEKSFILCSKDNKLVTHVISKYNQMANKPKRKRNKRRGKLIKESMRHRFYYPFLTKINTKGYLYTMSFIRYEDQVNILYKLYLAKILKYKFKYLPAFAYLTKKSVNALLRSTNTSTASHFRVRGKKASRLSDNTLRRVKGAGGTLSVAMKKRIKKRIKKGVRSKRIIRFIDNYYRYTYPKNGVKFNLLKTPRYKWYPLKIRKMYLKKWLKSALNKYKYENILNLKLLNNYNASCIKVQNLPAGTASRLSLQRLFRDTYLPLPTAVGLPAALTEDGSIAIKHEHKASLIRWTKKNNLIKVAIQRWLNINTEKRSLKLHKSVFTSYSFYTNLDSYNTPTRKDSSTISLEKKEYLKYFLINDWLNKENLLKDNYIINNIKNELVSNYFLNKTFARRFKSFDSLSYEPRFLLDLLPYQMIDFFNTASHVPAYGLLLPSAGQVKRAGQVQSRNLLTSLLYHGRPVDACEAAAASKSAVNSQEPVLWSGNINIMPYLINTSVEYSVPIHFDTQMTINLFRNLIIKQAAKRNKESSLLTFSLKGGLFEQASLLPASTPSGPQPAILAQLLLSECYASQPDTSRVPASAGLMLNIIQLKEKDNRFKFIKTYASSLNYCKYSAASSPTGLLRNRQATRSINLPSDIKLKNIVKVIQKLNLLKKIKLIKRIKEVVLNKNKQFYLERLVSEFVIFNLRKKTNEKHARVAQEVGSALPAQVASVFSLASRYRHTCFASPTLHSGGLLPTFASVVNKSDSRAKNLGLRKILLKSKLNSLQHIQSTNRSGEIITYNFNLNTRRLNIFNSFDFTGSSAAFRRSHGSYLNISVLIKYFFKTIGGAIISKPLFIYNHNKITIKLFYYLSKNIYFFSTSEKNKLLFLWLKNSNLEPSYISNLMKKYKNFLAKNPNIPFK